VERDDFLDPLSHDTIKKSWSVQSDESKTEITIRSLLWPGYVGYHRTNSSIFGGVYMGTGIRSQDLPFIL
jgi:radial spoke head protein 9